MSLGHGSSIVRSGLLIHYDSINVKDSLGDNGLKNLASNLYDGTRNYTSGTTTVEGVTYNRVDLAYKSSQGLVFDPKPPLPENKDNSLYYQQGGNWYQSSYSVPWGTNDFTWIVWVYFNSFRGGGLSNESTTPYILDWKRSSGQQSSFRADFGVPSVGYRITTSPFTTTSASSDKVLYSEDTWNFMCVRRQAGNIQFFNGFDKSGSISFNVNFEVANNLGIGWGADIDYQWRTLDGIIGPIQIYNRSLTDVEIQQNFNSYRGRYSI